VLVRTAGGEHERSGDSRGEQATDNYRARGSNHSHEDKNDYAKPKSRLSVGIGREKKRLTDDRTDSRVPSSG
jgi:hypothetical protein